MVISNNVDGAMFFDLHKASVRAILRDEQGNVIMAASKIENEVANLETIELLAIFRGLQLCAHLDFSGLTLESDSMLR